MAEGRLIRGLVNEDSVRVLGVDVTDICGHMAQAHEMNLGATRLGANGLVSTMLLSGQIKVDERLTLQAQVANLRASFIGEVDALGHVRGSMRPHELNWNDSQALYGTLVAIKHNAEKELYRGVTELRHTSMAEALADHLVKSSQLDVLLHVVVELDGQGVVRWAGGLVLERLPLGDGAESISNEVFQEKYGAIRKGSLRKKLRDLEKGRLLDGKVELLELKTLTWQCRCTRLKVKQTLAALGAETLREILHDPGHAAVTCHFCNETFTIPADELSALLALVQGAEHSAN